MSVTVTFENDEALVLFDAVASKRLVPTDIPERNALWALEALLERELVEPFRSDYDKLLESARASIVERMGD